MAENRNEELLINDEFCPSYSLKGSHLGDVERKNTPILGKVCAPIFLFFTYTYCGKNNPPPLEKKRKKIAG